VHIEYLITCVKKYILAPLITFTQIFRQSLFYREPTMSNEAVFSSDSTNIHISDSSVSMLLRVQAPLAGKILLVVGGLFFLIPDVLFALGGTSPNFALIAIYSVLWSLTIGRMILWNLFGTEHITITKHHVEFQRSYGLIQTGMQRHLLHSPLVITAIHQRETHGIWHGRMELTAMNEEGRKVLILKTGAHIPHQQIDDIIAAVHLLSNSTTSVPKE